MVRHQVGRQRISVQVLVDAVDLERHRRRTLQRHRRHLGKRGAVRPLRLHHVRCQSYMVIQTIENIDFHSGYWICSIVFLIKSIKSHKLKIHTFHSSKWEPMPLVHKGEFVLYLCNTHFFSYKNVLFLSVPQGSYF